jgi:hypothetical protein
LPPAKAGLLEANMKRIGIFSAVCVLTLVGAAPYDTGSGYPPCSATVTDSCIQLYEPGVATRTNLALNEELGPDRAGVGLAAMGGPYQPVEVEEDYAVWDDQAPEPEDWTADDDEYAAYEPYYEDEPEDYYAEDYHYDGM